MEEKTVKQKAAVLQELKMSFYKDQKSWLSNTNEEDAFKLCAENQVIKSIHMCNNSHGVPITTKQELEELVNNWEGTNALLHKFLNLKKRLRELHTPISKQLAPSSKLGHHVNAAIKPKNARQLNEHTSCANTTIQCI